MSKKEGILYFHQGWTDIVNCLALINYYSKSYNKIYLIMRSDAKNMIDYYVNGLQNIKLVYLSKSYLDEKDSNGKTKNTPKLIDNVKKLYDVSSDVNLLYHGGHRNHRIDKYKDSKNKSSLFCENFYVNFDIPYINRIQYFNIIRDHDLENKMYNDFVNKNGKEYILYHKVIENYDKTKKIVMLSESTDKFFDYIKILENSIEIHLLDSIWGAIVYHLDAKYKLFKDKNIFLYAKRGYHHMFNKPIKLNNWKII